MRGKLLILLFVLAYQGSQGQKTFKLEDVKVADTLLPLSSLYAIYQNIYEPNLRPHKNRDTTKPLKPALKIVAMNGGVDRLVDFQAHSFLNGLFHAYKTHRPIVISPDMIWLLISQGFSQHVHFNAEALRQQLVSFKGKKELTVILNDKESIYLNDPYAPWPLVFPRFTQQIGSFAGPELVKTLSANFTTTTPTTSMAAQITLMDAMKQYFEYKVIMIGCGLPAITLEGKTEDWEKILKKTKALSKYDLAWWTTRLEPILKEFIETSKGKINKKFWINFIKKHEEKTAYGLAVGIDGHVLQFYPYDKKGKRLKGEFIWGTQDLPDEIVKVPLKYELHNANGTVIEKANLMIWSGFVGCSQNNITKALKPEIGWMICYDQTDSLQQAEYKNAVDRKMMLVENISNGAAIPAALLALDYIPKLTLNFNDGIFNTNPIRLPEEFFKIKIDTLYLNGSQSYQASQLVFDRFGQTKVYINKKSRQDLDRYIQRRQADSLTKKTRIEARDLW